MTYTGDLGYEIWVAPEHQRALFDLLWEAGRPYGMALFGFRALMSLRMEKRFGTWFREYRPIYTPLEAGHGPLPQARPRLHRPARAVEAELARGPERSLVYLDVDPDPDEPADVIGDEPIWHDGRRGRVGWVTSGAYAHYSGRSLALGYVPAELAVRRRRGVRDRDHRPPPPGPPAHRAGVRPGRRADAGALSGPARPDVERRAAAARRGRRLPRRARAGRRVAAPDGDAARRQRQRPRPPLRLEGGSGRRGAAAGRPRSRQDVAAPWLRRRPTRRRPTCCGGGGGGSTPRRRTWPWSGSASRRPRSTPPSAVCRVTCAPSRSALWRADIEQRLVAEGMEPERRRGRGLAGEGDVHRARRRPARHRRAPPARPALEDAGRRSISASGSDPSVSAGCSSPGLRWTETLGHVESTCSGGQRRRCR